MPSAIEKFSTTLDWVNFAKLGQITASVLAIIALISLTFVDEGNRFIDEGSTIVLSCFIVSFVIASYLSIALSSVELQLFNIFNGIIFWPRIFQFAQYDEMVVFPLNFTAFEKLDIVGDDLTSSDIYHGFLIYFLFYIAFACSLLLPQIIRNRQYKVPDTTNEKLVLCCATVFFIISICLEATVFGNPEYSPYNQTFDSKSTLSIFYKISVVIFGTDTSLLILTFFACKSLKRTSSKSHFVCILALCIFASILFIFTVALNGSRGPSYTIFMSTITFLVIMRPNVKQKYLLISICSLSIATSIWSSAIGDISRTTLKKGESPIYTVECLLFNKCSDEKTLNANSFWSKLDRLAVTDYALISLSSNPNPDCVSTRISLTRQLKHMANFLMVGTPYPEAVRSSANEFTQCFIGFENPSQAYNAEPWTAPGMLMTLFGHVGLLLIFIAGLFVCYINRLLINQSNMLSAYYFALIMPSLGNGVFFLMGFDHFFTTFCVLFVRLCAFGLFVFTSKVILKTLQQLLTDSQTKS